jgi:hypothetical protein
VALNFPDSPTVGQIYSINDRQWTWDGVSWNLTLSGATQTRWTKTATAGQTVASGLDNNSLSLTYKIGYEQAYLNGALLVRGSDYTATTGTSITFASALTASDIIEIVSFGSLQINSAVNTSSISGSGELFVGTSNQTVGVLGAGLLNQVLTADPTVSGGIRWSENDVTPIDTLRYKFDGLENRFQPTYQGSPITISNPLRILLTVNGIIQTVSFPEYVWQSDISRDGFMVDNDGYLAFSEVPPAGSTFDARIMAGPVLNTKTTNYPFLATDILLGAY